MTGGLVRSFVWECTSNSFCLFFEGAVFLGHQVVCKYLAVDSLFAHLVQGVSSAILIYLILACAKKKNCDHVRFDDESN
jgi:hypothetical protein